MLSLSFRKDFVRLPIGQKILGLVALLTNLLFIILSLIDSAQIFYILLDLIYLLLALGTYFSSKRLGDLTYFQNFSTIVFEIYAVLNALFGLAVSFLTTVS